MSERLINALNELNDTDMNWIESEYLTINLSIYQLELISYLYINISYPKYKTDESISHLTFIHIEIHRMCCNSISDTSFDLDTPTPED